MHRNQWFESKWRWLHRFAWLGAAGVALMVAGAATEWIACLAIGMALLTPLIFWIAFIPVLHWKDRHVGSHSTVWGAFLAFEVSGWSKLAYWVVHVLPDKRRTGAYADVP